ncbi:VWA domain-containing protein [Photobacterium chitinilyticum]|uniref:TadE/TadG family type IV pilus assembly protein n=1 Tax=Photobacterium chitinilyticum TaxID=2485123 RepID=UPI003D10D5D4
MTSRFGRRVQPQQALRQRGAISLTFVMLLPVLLAVISVAIFFSMYTLAVVRAGQASDAASVACAYQQRGSNSVIQRYLDYYRPVFVPDAFLASHQLDAQQGCQISAQYNFEPLMPEVLPTVAQGKTQVHVNSVSTSRLLTSVASKSTDFSLVLDISGSMVEELPELKQIITHVIEDIDPLNNKVRFSIVPFQTGVTVKNAPWYPVSNRKAKCVDGLSYTAGRWGLEVMDPEQTVDDLNLPASRLTMKEVTPGPWLDRCSETATILPLTDDFSQLKSYVSKLETSGSNTASYQGLIWGIRTLTEQWQQEWLVSNLQPVQSVQRLVLFTDGKDLPKSDYFNELIEAGLCQVIRQDHGIEMSFIGFGVTDSRLEQFRRCAGSGDVVYDAQDIADLEDYFRTALDVESQTRIVLGK